MPRAHWLLVLVLGLSLATLGCGKKKDSASSSSSDGGSNVSTSNDDSNYDAEMGGGGHGGGGGNEGGGGAGEGGHGGGEGATDSSGGGEPWVVLSNFRKLGQAAGTFGETYKVDYRWASGRPNSAMGMVWVIEIPPVGGIGIGKYHEEHVSLEPNGGTLTVGLQREFGGSTPFCFVGRSRGLQEYDKLSGHAELGGGASDAQPPKSIVELAGSSAVGKPVAIANARIDNSGIGPGDTYVVDYEVQSPPPGLRLALIVESVGGEGSAEFEVGTDLRREKKGTIRGQVIGADFGFDPPFVFYIASKGPGFNGSSTPVSNKIRTDGQPVAGGEGEMVASAEGGHGGGNENPFVGRGEGENAGGGGHGAEMENPFVGRGGNENAGGGGGHGAEMENPRVGGNENAGGGHGAEMENPPVGGGRIPPRFVGGNENPGGGEGEGNGGGERPIDPANVNIPDAPTAPKGTPQYTVQYVLIKAAKGDQSGLGDWISEEATGELASLRDGKLTDEQLAQMKAQIGAVQFVDAKTLPSGLRLFVLRNIQGQTVQITLRRRRGKFLVDGLSVAGTPTAPAFGEGGGNGDPEAGNLQNNEGGC